MHYPAWKYILIAVVLAIAGLYALPNLYPDEPAVQITGASAGTELTSDVLVQSQALLDKAGLAYHDGSFANNSALIRLNTAEDQLKAQETLRQNLGENYTPMAQKYRSKTDETGTGLAWGRAICPRS